MNVEIEKKFLVKDYSFTSLAQELWHIRQGFIIVDAGRSLRIREDRAVALTKYTLGLKISHSELRRDEYEYPISEEDGVRLLESCHSLIEKDRYRVYTMHNHILGTFWDIDVFHGDNEGLVIAEMEMPSEDFKFKIPDWVGEDVTADPRYLNTNLSKNPYRNWK